VRYGQTPWAEVEVETAHQAMALIADGWQIVGLREELS
jgi:hypothetical protein